MKIYEGKQKTKDVDYNLIENYNYILDFEDDDEYTIKKEIKNSKLSDFIDWQEGNRFGKLCITNYIGNIYFFNKTYDVKSIKFLTELSGVEQFRTLLNEIEQLSRNVIFSYSSPSFALRQVDYKDTNPTTLLIFNYFKKVILDWDATINIESSIQRILKNPNFKYSAYYGKDRIEKIRKIDNKTLKYLLNKSSEFVKIDDETSHILNLPITKVFSKNSSEYYFPTKSIIRKNKLSYDTPENRFIKYFIRYVASFAYRLNFVKNLPKPVNDEKVRILKFCRKTLNKPFFKELGEMRFVPTNSTVLQSRAGYKEILGHYTRSRFGIKHIFEEFEKDALSIDLKKISDLYEYWVFYKIAKAFLGNDIIIEQQDVIENDGNISYGVCFRNDLVSVYYNWSESKSRKSSYSVNLRPDTTVVIKKEESLVKLIFDAKYKVQSKKSEENIERHVKREDIHKMHAYLDAIKGAEFAVVVYPGTEFYFYERAEYNKPVRKSIDEIENFEGVGAIPLVPKNIEQYKQLDKLVDKINNSFLK